MPRGGYRANAGRPQGSTKADGLPTHVVRVSTEITRDQCQAIPSLISVLDYWEAQCVANASSPRYDFLRKAIEEIRTLGY